MALDHTAALENNKLELLKTMCFQQFQFLKSPYYFKQFLILILIFTNHPQKIKS